jgi:hypothetical protein
MGRRQHGHLIPGRIELTRNQESIIVNGIEGMITMTSKTLQKRRSVLGVHPGIIITDPKTLAALRPSPKALAEIKRLDSATMRPLKRIIIGSPSS